ncbi:hypothetical protein [Mycolicibacterium cosmeticum]|uniref:hypothetical protein n=1 Tax=Mycolicibacterium cosmeticum TaxID=258533 RepID=UPI003204E83A
MSSPTDLSTSDVGDADDTGYLEDTDGESAHHSEQTPARNKSEQASQPGAAVRRIKSKTIVTYGLLPALALIMAVAAGYLKYLDVSSRNLEIARSRSIYAATDGTIAMLSYRPDTAERDLTGAQDRLTGSFRDSYARLTRDVVIPGAKEKQISAQATAPAAASVTADRNHAVVLIFVNQTITIGTDAPTNTSSTVRVALDNVDGRWLISAFDPI